MASQAGSMNISSVDVVERCSLKETDTIIAVIGATGTGKSTFIEAASGGDVGIGHQLEPYTKAIVAYRIKFSSSPETVVLIDTPGYGYASLSDKSVLDSLSKWLQAPYANAIPLSGILYMHRISDNPGTCSPLKNFETYRKLCGEDPLRKLILVTTIWDLEGEGNSEHKNESHLRDEYELRMERFLIGMKAPESAWNILKPLIHANTRRLRMAECLAARIMPSPDHCLSLLLEIAGNEEKRQALCTLRNGDAQVMVDYMNLELRKMDISKDKIVGQVCSLLCKFSKSARVFPKSFQVSSIRMSKRHITGGFADVCKGTHRSSGLAVAVKTMRQRDQWELEQYRLLLKELSLWAYLSHPNILPFYGVYCYGPKCKSVAIISPWMDNGNLHGYAKNRPQHEKLSLLLDVVKGLLYLHDLNIVHGDIKGANILVSNDQKALIADFGISHNITTATAAKTVNVHTRGKTISADSPRWTAPEICMPSVAEPMSDVFVMASKPSDIWAFGCVVYEIVSGKLPYEKCDDKLVVSAITNGRLPGQPHRNDERGGIPEESVPWRLAKYCWNRDHTQRPTCGDVHTFFTEHFQNAGEKSDTQDATSESSRKFWEDTSKDLNNVDINFSRIHFLLCEASNSGGWLGAGHNY